MCLFSGRRLREQIQHFFFFISFPIYLVPYQSCWRDVGQARFSRIPVMSRQFLTVSVDSPTTERVFSLSGLTLSCLCKYLVDGTLEVIMWVQWGRPSIPFDRGDLHITHLNFKA
jgi:hypothetical protein